MYKIESFTAPLLNLHSTYQQLFVLTDKDDSLTSQLNGALYKLTCKSLWLWFWLGLLAALIMGSVWVCVYQPSPLSPFLVNPSRPPAGMENVPEQRLEAAQETTTSTSR